jgi:hypothetical protein
MYEYDTGMTRIRHSGQSQRDPFKTGDLSVLDITEGEMIKRLPTEALI